MVLIYERPELNQCVRGLLFQFTSLKYGLVDIIQ